ncbi:hypothetical protein COLO4_38358 [Corchorus olitorius]|uniref:Uncharacterized protein n=1 Tax=Corchorus olitorius TaxID=93759 RepID=A0A1R3FVK2_9ROSI|nr:hypothetical protein COLO4_38358 [Corchorus olitorius]
MGVCIFRVRDNVVAVKPEAYVPQLIGLGHYHHFHSELYDMENYKLAAVKRAIRMLREGDGAEAPEEFNKIVEKISKLNCPPMCNAYRHDLENHNHKEMACIMAIDGLFLVDLFQTNEGGIIPPTQTQIQPKPNPHAILKDVLKLESQIPMSVLKTINSKVEENKKRPGHPKLRLLHDQFRRMMVKFCNDVSPIDLDWESTLPRQLGKSQLELCHLLDLLYHYIVGKEEDDDHQHKGGPNPNPNQPKKEDTNCEPISNLLKKLSEFPKLVSELHNVGVEFKPIEAAGEAHGAGGPQKVEFNEKKKTFYLPVVILKPTTEVVLRNLVAYETMAKSKSSTFKRYTELMSAIVDTVEDVKILMEAQVLVFRKEDDDVERQSLTVANGKECLSEVEIADMFNGITKMMESKDRVIDEAIRKVNKCCDNTRKVKAYRMMMRYVFSSWKMLTIFASLLLLLLNAVQTFCDLYDCPAIFRTQGQGTSTQATGCDLLFSFADSHLSQ